MSTRNTTDFPVFDPYDLLRFLDQGNKFTIRHRQLRNLIESNEDVVAVIEVKTFDNRSFIYLNTYADTTQSQREPETQQEREVADAERGAIRRLAFSVKGPGNGDLEMRYCDDGGNRVDCPPDDPPDDPPDE